MNNNELEIWEYQISVIEKAIKEALAKEGIINPSSVRKTEENENESLCRRWKYMHRILCCKK